jgi:hypothetical protein
MSGTNKRALERERRAWDETVCVLRSACVPRTRRPLPTRLRAFPAVVSGGSGGAGAADEDLSRTISLRAHQCLQCVHFMAAQLQVQVQSLNQGPIIFLPELLKRRSCRVVTVFV